MAIENITPGSRVTLKVTSKPTNAAAAKTIVRLLSKDKTVKADQARQRSIRKTHFRQAPRGGRLWNVNVVKQASVKAEVGVEKSIIASLDVLRDLQSVQRFVEVTPA